MINASVSYAPHVVANLAYTALTNLDKAWENAQSLFLEAAEESYERMALTGRSAKFFDWLRRAPRAEFDFDYELNLMVPIQTNEPDLPEFNSAADQFAYIKRRMADLHNRVGMIATAARTAGAIEVQMSAEDYYWLVKMASGESLLFRPVSPRTNDV